MLKHFNPEPAPNRGNRAHTPAIPSDEPGVASLPSSMAPPKTPAAPAPPANPLKTKALRALDDLPPFSPIMNRLLASLAGDDVSFSSLGDLIEKDTVIAGNLLRVVNSALYARRSAINSVRHALSILGIGKLRNLVLGMSVAQMWNRTRVPQAWSMKRFDMHSAAVAILSDLLAQLVPATYPEGAFAAGLFHDLGRLLIVLALPQETAAIANQFARGGGTLLQCEQNVLGFTHADVSAEALAIWKLPWPVQAAVATHHDNWPEAASAESGNEIPMGRLIGAANQFVNSTGSSIDIDPRIGASDPSAIDSLGLEPERLARLKAEFRDEYMGLLQFFT